MVDEGLGNASYLVDLGDGSALVVDPVRDPRVFLAEAERRGLRLALVADTHLHNDFVSGNLELAEAGAEVLMPEAAEASFPHRAVADGDEVEAGRFRVEVLASPGHTPEHVSYLLLDGSAPVALFSGGALLRGSVARTDLLGRDAAEGLSRALHATVRRLLELPDEVVVYPTHGAGETYCAVTPPSGVGARTTIGAERTSDPLLALEEERFVEALARSAGSFPRYFRFLREVNRAPRAVFGTRTPQLERLTVQRFASLAAGGAEIVDARRPSAFARGHLPGSLSIHLRPVFATWLGWLVERGRPLMFVLDEDQDRDELVRRCLTIGYEQLLGELDGGTRAWASDGRPLGTVPLVAPDAVDGSVLDVRQRSEFQTGHIPGALQVELGALGSSIEAVPAGPLTVHCAHGERAMTGASLLERAGRTDVNVMRGGPGDWAGATGRPLASEPPP